jgi:hypothetical protein
MLRLKPLLITQIKGFILAKFHLSPEINKVKGSKKMASLTFFPSWRRYRAGLERLPFFCFSINHYLCSRKF